VEKGTEHGEKAGPTGLGLCSLLCDSHNLSFGGVVWKLLEAACVSLLKDLVERGDEMGVADVLWICSLPSKPSREWLAEPTGRRLLDV
jgi:hypothetical protein